MTNDNQNQGGSENRGFSTMDPKKKKEVARKGGQSQGKDNNPGNYANRDQREESDQESSM